RCPVRRGRRLPHSRVRRRRRRRDRVHAVREPGRRRLVLTVAAEPVRAPAAAKLRAVDATKVYETKTGPVHALEAVSADVEEGELVCILGPSGCGKTTLLWAMSGLHRLTRGQILLDGQPVVEPRPAQIGMIFQDANLLPWRNLRQNLEFPF